MSQELSPLPNSNSPPLQGERKLMTTAWYQYFWRQWLGLFPVKCAPVNEPQAPASGFVIFCDVSDGILKAKSSLGTITVLANP